MESPTHASGSKRIPSSSIHKRDPVRSAAARQRVRRACVPCATRRHKCDGGQPVCQRCINNELECAFPPTTERSRSTKRRNRRAASPPSAEEDLEGSASPPPVGSSESPDKSEDAAEVPKEAEGGQQREPNPPLVAVPGVPLFYSRFASMSLVGDQKSCGQEYEGDTDFSTSTFVQPAALSEDLICRLLTNYWELIHVLWPMFIKESITNRRNSLIYNHVPALAVNAMLVVAAGTLEDCSPIEEHALAVLQQRTEEEALLATGESPTVTIVQVLLLLGIKTLRTSQRHKSWNFFGLACRTVLDLGYHRDRPLHPNHEVYRRIWWISYVWDKLIGIEQGKPWLLRRGDSDTKLISEDLLEEWEVVSAIFSREHGPAPGRVLSSFNSHCRVAVLMEKLMDLRRPFPSIQTRAAAVLAMDTICGRWVETLAPHLRISDDVTSSNLILQTIHSQMHCCAALLHLPIASEAIRAGRTVDDDASLRRLLVCSRYWANISRTSGLGAHFMSTIAPARPISFPLLLVGTVNNILNTPETLLENQHMLQKLEGLVASGRKTFQRSETLKHIIENLRPIIPEVPAFVPESLEDPFNRFGAVGCDADQGKPNPPQTEGSLLTTPADHADFWLDLELPPIISSQTFVPHPSDSWGRVPWQAVQSFR